MPSASYAGSLLAQNRMKNKRSLLAGCQAPESSHGIAAMIFSLA